MNILKTKYIMTYLVLFLFFISIMYISFFMLEDKSDLQKSNLDFKTTISYKQNYNSLDKHLVKYFPSLELEDVTSISYEKFLESPEKGIVFQMSFEMNSSKITELYKTYEDQAILITNAEQDNLLINPRYSNSFDKNRKELPLNSFPVPSFYSSSFYEVPLNSFSLPLSYTYFVLEAEPIQQQELTWQTKYDWGVAASPKWQHGYSLGAAISLEDNSVFYWADKW